MLNTNPNFTYDKFFEIIDENISRFKNRVELFNNLTSVNIVSKDARKFEKSS